MYSPHRTPIFRFDVLKNNPYLSFSEEVGDFLGKIHLKIMSICPSETFYPEGAS